MACADAYKDHRNRRAAQCGGKAYADFREILARKDIDAVIVATPDHWHVPIAIMAARAGKDCYVEKPLGICVEQDLLCRKVFQEHDRVFQYGTQAAAALTIAGSAANSSAADGSARSRPSRSLRPTAGPADQPRKLPCRPASITKCGWVPPRPSPIPPIAATRKARTGFMINRSATWAARGAHPLDILVWGCDADKAGPWSVDGSGKVPETGLYDTVYDWDMKFTFTGDVTMRFTPGSDSTKFIGTDGWIRIWRENWDAEPKSLLKEAAGSGGVHLLKSAEPLPEFCGGGEVAIGHGQPAAGCRAQRPDEPHVRHRGPARSQDHLGPEAGNHRR